MIKGVDSGVVTPTSTDQSRNPSVTDQSSVDQALSSLTAENEQPSTSSAVKASDVVPPPKPKRTFAYGQPSTSSVVEASDVSPQPKRTFTHEQAGARPKTTQSGEGSILPMTATSSRQGTEVSCSQNLNEQIISLREGEIKSNKDKLLAKIARNMDREQIDKAIYETTRNIEKSKGLSRLDILQAQAEREDIQSTASRNCLLQCCNSMIDFFVSCGRRIYSSYLERVEERKIRSLNRAFESFTLDALKVDQPSQMSNDEYYKLLKMLKKTSSVGLAIKNDSPALYEATMKTVSQGIVDKILGRNREGNLEINEQSFQEVLQKLSDISNVFSMLQPIERVKYKEGIQILDEAIHQLCIQGVRSLSEGQKETHGAIKVSRESLEEVFSLDENIQGNELVENLFKSLDGKLDIRNITRDSSKEEATININPNNINKSKGEFLLAISEIFDDKTEAENVSNCLAKLLGDNTFDTAGLAMSTYRKSQRELNLWNFLLSQEPDKCTVSHKLSFHEGFVHVQMNKKVNLDSIVFEEGSIPLNLTTGSEINAELSFIIPTISLKQKSFKHIKCGDAKINYTLKTDCEGPSKIVPIKTVKHQEGISIDKKDIILTRRLVDKVDKLDLETISSKKASGLLEEGLPLFFKVFSATDKLDLVNVNNLSEICLKLMEKISPDERTRTSEFIKILKNSLPDKSSECLEEIYFKLANSSRRFIHTANLIKSIINHIDCIKGENLLDSLDKKINYKGFVDISHDDDLIREIEATINNNIHEIKDNYHKVFVTDIPRASYSFSAEQNGSKIKPMLDPTQLSKKDLVKTREELIFVNREDLGLNPELFNECMTAIEESLAHGNKTGREVRDQLIKISSIANQSLLAAPLLSQMKDGPEEDIKQIMFKKIISPMGGNVTYSINLKEDSTELICSSRKDINSIDGVDVSDRSSFTTVLSLELPKNIKDANGDINFIKKKAQVHLDVKFD